MAHLSLISFCGVIRCYNLPLIASYVHNHLNMTTTHLKVTTGTRPHCNDLTSTFYLLFVTGNNCSDL